MAKTLIALARAPAVAFPVPAEAAAAEQPATAADGAPIPLPPGEPHARGAARDASLRRCTREEPGDAAAGEDVSLARGM